MERNTTVLVRGVDVRPFLVHQPLDKGQALAFKGGCYQRRLSTDISVIHASWIGIHPLPQPHLFHAAESEGRTFAAAIAPMPLFPRLGS